MKYLKCEWIDITSGYIRKRKNNSYKIIRARIEWLTLFIEYDKPCYFGKYVFSCRELGVENYDLDAKGWATAKNKAGAKCQKQLGRLRELLEFKVRSI